MKTKILIATALVAISMNAMAADATDDSTQQQGLQAIGTSGNIGTSSGMNNANDAMSNDNNTISPDANNDMSADTATGDDDY